MIQKEADRIGVNKKALQAFIEVESSGEGFDPSTGKLMIQFEPDYFRKYAKAQYHAFLSIQNSKVLNETQKKLLRQWAIINQNKVDSQPAEWSAFNEAFKINADAARKSTSIGIGQVMGFNFERLGYRKVEDMWADAESGIDRQIFQMTEFIRTDTRLLKALRTKDWHLVATYYNGEGYRDLARKNNWIPYDQKFRNACNKLCQ